MLFKLLALQSIGGVAPHAPTLTKVLSLVLGPAHLVSVAARSQYHFQANPAICETSLVTTSQVRVSLWIV